MRNERGETNVRRVIHVQLQAGAARMASVMKISSHGSALNGVCPGFGPLGCSGAGEDAVELSHLANRRLELGHRLGDDLGDWLDRIDPAGDLPRKGDRRYRRPLRRSLPVCGKAVLSYRVAPAMQTRQIKPLNGEEASAYIRLGMRPAR